MCEQEVPLALAAVGGEPWFQELSGWMPARMTSGDAQLR